MAKERKEGINKGLTTNTSTKLNPGQPPVASDINTKVKAAKEADEPASDKEKNLKTNIKNGKDRIILITNDDGVTSPGIAALVDAVKDLGKVVVIAPDKAQSGMGHAITIGSPLRMSAVNTFAEIEAYECNGTPVDCVKLAVDKVLHRKPDICLSGINHGANHSINVIYSGTMSAALEAAIESIPSVGFSLLDYSLNADFAGAKKYARLIVEQLLTKKTIDKHLCLNVNVPAVDVNVLRGIKVCRQAYAKYEEDFDERVDPHGRKYYWLTGEFVNFDKGRDTDVWALNNNYVSVVPVQFDLTNYKLKDRLEKTLKW
ncbi:MAG: 5'/3'-nucleotidase SurE [Segetibacter sp.]|nr:5'/3'-nucleotidase SurE [Segetibacter sp.]